jgi:hypothetical protein
MTKVYNNKFYIQTFTEHAKWLIENSTHKLWIVYLNNKNMEKEQVNKHNYKALCGEIDRCIEKQIESDQIFIVVDVPELTMRHTENSYKEQHLSYNSTYENFISLRFGSKDY